MHGLKMSVTKTILGLSIIMYTAGQVSSLKCYVCTSTIGQDCYNNPKKEEYEVTCPETRGSDSSFSKIIDSLLLSALIDDPGTTDADAPATPVSHNCCEVKGTIFEVEGVIRSCQPKTLSDEDIKKAAIAAGVAVKSVQRCENDLCNFFDASSTTSSVPPVISTTHPPITSQKPLPSSSSKPSSAPSSTHSPVPPTTHSPVTSTTHSPVPSTTHSPVPPTTHSPVPPTTNVPNSSRALSTAILSFATSLFVVYFVKL